MQENRLAMRMAFALLGAAAGFSFWGLTDLLGDRIGNPRMLLALHAFAAVFFGGALAMFGPLGRRALLPAAVLGAGVSALLTLASLRHPTTGPFFDLRYPGLAAVLLACLPLPFVMAAQRRGEGWRNYAALFTHSWSIVARYAAGAVFVGIAWLVLTVSDALLRLVGIGVITDLRELSWFGPIFTGVALGLALAVVHEFTDYVSAFLILRLFRLLMPVVLLVVAVFLIALPLQGFENPFGQGSVAVTLLTMAAGVTLLVSSAVDAADDVAVRTRLLQTSARGLALVLPVLAVVAGYAVWLRVGQHGWTPQRLMGAAAVLVLGCYGMLYALAVVRPGRWMRRIRRANLAMAVLLVGFAALWLTPVIVPERISARSQLDGYLSGVIEADDLPLWQMRDAWGYAGRAALATLQAREDDPPLARALARLEANRQQEGEGTGLRRNLLALLPVIPEEGADLAEALTAATHPAELRLWLNGCRRLTPAGYPGCALVVADFLPGTEGQEALLLYSNRGGFLGQEGFSRTPDGTLVRMRAARLEGAEDAARLLDALQSGDFRIGPPRIDALLVGEGSFVLIP